MSSQSIENSQESEIETNVSMKSENSPKNNQNQKSNTVKQIPDSTQQITTTEITQRKTSEKEKEEQKPLIKSQESETKSTEKIVEKKDNDDKKTEASEKEDKKKKEYKRKYTRKQIWNRNMTYIKRFWKQIVIMQLLSFIPMYIRLVQPLNEVKLLESAISENQQIFLDTMYYYLLYQITNMIVQPLYSSLQQTIQKQIRVQISSELFKHAMNADIEFYEIYNSQEIQNMMGGGGIHHLTQKITLDFLLQPIKSIISSFTAFYTLYLMNSTVTWYLVGLIPVYIFKAKYFENKYQKMDKGRQQQVNKRSYNTYELIRNIKLVKTFGNEETEIQKFEDSQVKQQEQNKIYDKINKIQNICSSLLNISRTFILMYCVLNNLFDETFEDGEYSSSKGRVTVLSTFLRESGAFLGFYYAYLEIKKLLGFHNEQTKKHVERMEQSIDQFYEMLSYKAKVQYNGTQVLKQEQGGIEFKDVEFAYPKNKDVKILQNISFSVKKGSYSAFVGKSGAGKSTIIKLIQRFYDSDKGTISIGGNNIKDIQKQSLKTQIGYVSQDIQLFNDTIKMNIVYGLEEKDYSEPFLELVLKMSGCYDFIENDKLFPKGLDTIVGEAGQRLSGGQLQRLAIARALVRKPTILIFDEATSSLDAEREYQVQQNIETLSNNNALNVTILVIAHRLSTIVNCSNIFLIDDGQIVQQGDHHSLMEDEEGQYYKLIQRQIPKKKEQLDINSLDLSLMKRQD